MNISEIWKNKLLILEGLKNTLIKDEFVEEVAKARDEICRACEMYDKSGKHCNVPLTQPCCKYCGCSLTLKERSLDSTCPIGKWDAISQ